MCLVEWYNRTDKILQQVDTLGSSYRTSNPGLFDAIMKVVAEMTTSSYMICEVKGAIKGRIGPCDGSGTLTAGDASV